MSRSYRKSYVYIACCNSKKKWRSSYNRRFRHLEDAGIRNDEEFQCSNNPYKFFFADLWIGPTDGGSYYFTPDDSVNPRKFCKFKRHGHYLLHK